MSPSAFRLASRGLLSNPSAYAASVEFNRLGSLSGMVVSVAVLAVAAILVQVVRAAVLAVG